jgi:peptidoglycan/LPS O-acetylase OafA/YrhL
MAGRERKRAERQKRKARTAERRERMAAASEERNRAAREKLEPLEPEERPAIVTVGAVISGAIAISVIVGYLLGAEVDGDRPNLFQVIVPALLMGVMCVGMWRVRYWAVLGFQAVLGLLIVAGVLGAVSATSARSIVGTLVLIAVAGTLFYFMIGAMARIQMPERKPPD